jgi:hypothetical protein
MSSSPITSAPLLAGRQVIIYGGLSILSLGLVGSFLNTVVFLSLQTFRQNSCAFYLTIMSVVNIGQMLTGFMSRIAINGFDVDWTETSLFYCKFRYFAFQTCALLSVTCICLATIDQYCATTSRIAWQQWSNVKTAHRLVIIAALLEFAHGIPYLFLYDHVNMLNSTRVYCSSRNYIYLQYHTYIFTLTLTGCLPIFITVLFGLLSYRNVRRMAYRAVPLIRRELEKQLTTMVLIQVVLNCFTVLPFSITNTFAFNTSVQQDKTTVARIQLVGSIMLCLYYCSFAVCMTPSEHFTRSFSPSLFVRAPSTSTYVCLNDFVINLPTYYAVSI